MRRFLFALVFVIAAQFVGRVEGHGFDISVNENSNSVPVSLSETSESPVLDQQGATQGPQNLFLDAFGNLSSDQNGNYFPTIEGFAFHSTSFPTYTASFNVISPLYFSSGTGSPAQAVTAPTGTMIDIFDLWAGNPEPITSPHPGAAFGDVFVTGNSSFASGIGVSLLDPHELEKDLYIGSGPTNGEYGFAFDVTVNFAGGPTLTTGPLVDVFAISDPTYGDFADNAPVAQQDAATLAIFNAATAVPEPSTWALLAMGAIGLAVGMRTRRRAATQNARRQPSYDHEGRNGRI